MTYRVLPLFLATMALALFVSTGALAASEKGQPHHGKVVKAADGKLTMIGEKDKKEHSAAVASDATITLDGKACQLEDLKEGIHVKVTLKEEGGKRVVSKIEASTKDDDNDKK